MRKRVRRGGRGDKKGRDESRERTVKSHLNSAIRRSSRRMEKPNENEPSNVRGARAAVFAN